MTLWIIIALLIVVPLGLQLRGAGLVVLLAAAACLFGVYISAVGLASISPGLAAHTVFGALTNTSEGFAFRTASANAIVAMAYAATLATLIFAGLAALFFALTRWGAPIAKRPSKILFWGLHLSFTGLFIYCAAAILSAPDIPFDPAATTTNHVPFELILATFTFAQLICVIGFALLAVWSITCKLRR